MEALAAAAAIKLSIYLKNIATEEYFEKYNEFLIAEVEEGLLQEAYAESPQMYEEVQTYFEGDILCETCLELAALAFMEPRTLEVLSEISYGTTEGVTLEVAAKILFPEYNSYVYYDELLSAYTKLKKIFILEDDRPDFFRNKLIIDKRLVNHFMNVADDLGHKNYVKVFGKDEERIQPVSSRDLIKNAQDYISKIWKNVQPEKDAALIQITGEHFSGRKFLVKHVAGKMKKDVYFVDYQGLLTRTTRELEKEIAFLIRETVLTSGIICINDVIFKEQEEVFGREYFLANVIRPFFKNGISLFITGNKNTKLAPFLENSIHEIEVLECSKFESEELWDFYTNKYLTNTKIDGLEMANKMKLTPGQIRQIVKKVALHEKEEIITSKTVFKLCYSILDDGRYENIKRIDSKYTWEDLKMEESQKNILKSIYNQVQFKLKVFVEWNFESKFPYGKGVSALFSGPPGTGKTMAVHVLASMLGLELYKVDISQIVDKYIGETEKRLEEVFTRAEKSNLILFFDEADAIFGKRSEVSDSKDKYANTEVSFILQRIEEYEGIVILASNYGNNIDPAFKRRIKYKVDFTLPNQEIRKSIWESVYPEEMPKEELNYEYLANNFEFTGGLIKNIALNAAFLAAAEGGILEMKHILICIKSEYIKMGKMVSNKDFGKYEALL